MKQPQQSIDWDSSVDERPSLAIVIATHERPQYLSDCLTAVQAQTIAPNEVVVVDDGPSGSAVDVVRSFSKNLPVRYVANPAKGVGAARNLGCRIATADWIVIQDDDDLMLPTRLAEHYRHIQSADVDVSYGGWVNFDLHSGNAEAYPGKPFQEDDFYLAGLVLTHGAAAIRRELLLDTPYREDLRSGVDFILFSALERQRARFEHCGAYILLRRLHHERLSLTDTPSQTYARSEAVRQWSLDSSPSEERRLAASARPFSKIAISSEVLEGLAQLGVSIGRLLIPVNRRWGRSSSLFGRAVASDLPMTLIDPGSGARVLIELLLVGVAEPGLKAALALSAEADAPTRLGAPPAAGGYISLTSPLPGRQMESVIIQFHTAAGAQAVMQSGDQSRWLWSLCDADQIGSKTSMPETTAKSLFEAFPALSAYADARIWLGR